MKNIFLGLMVALSLPPAHAQKPVDDLYLYKECVSANGKIVKLYVATLAGEARPSILTLNDFAYLGKTDAELKKFTAYNGNMTTVFRLDAAGNTVSAKAVGLGFEQTFENCTDNLSGGGSVSVHN